MPAVALSLLAQVFLIIHHKPLVRRLISLLLGPCADISTPSLPDSALHPTVVRFVAPDVSLTDDFKGVQEQSSSGQGQHYLVLFVTLVYLKYELNKTSIWRASFIIHMYLTRTLEDTH